jgi:eukaryotic-like serine/threonine-protein kinase
MTYIPGDVILYKYRVEKWLSGDLYQVTQLSRNARRMLQVVSMADANMTEELFRRTNDEFQAAVRLSDQISHPNLLKVLDSDASGDLLVLLMEDMPGGSLADRLAKVTPGTAAVSAADAVQMGTQIAEGLQALHGRGYVHGDLQPSNIFFDEQGHIKLGGLGKAKIPGYSFELFPAPLSMPSDFLSPEQKSGSKNLSFASDIYSLGCILFGLLSGRVYSRQQPVTKVGAMLIKGPDWLSALILRMLSPDPSQRPADGGAAARLLQAAGKLVETPAPDFPASQSEAVELLPDMLQPAANKIEQLPARLEAAQAKLQQAPARVAQAVRNVSDPIPVGRPHARTNARVPVGLVIVIIFFIVLCIVLAILGRI